MTDPHPKLPAAEGWQPAATAPQTAVEVQLGYPPVGFNGPAILVAHWAQDLSGEEQPPYRGWFQANVGDGGKVHGYREAPAGFVAWRPLWPAVLAEPVTEGMVIALRAKLEEHAARLGGPGNLHEAIRAALGDVLPMLPAFGWQPTRQHAKGGYYRVICQAVQEATMVPAMVYDDAFGRVWVRPASEFSDGRFTSLRPGARPGA